MDSVFLLLASASSCTAADVAPLVNSDKLYSCIFGFIPVMIMLLITLLSVGTDINMSSELCVLYLFDDVKK